MRFQLGLILAIGATIAAFNFTTYPDPPRKSKSVFVPMEEEIQVIRTAEDKPKELPPPKVEVTDIIETADEIDFIEEKPVELLDTKVEVDPNAEKIFVELPAPKREAPIKKITEVIPEEKEEDLADEIKLVVDEMPRFNACEDLTGTAKEKQACATVEMLKYVHDRIKYPSIAKEVGIEGRVIIQFVVEKDGSITQANIVRDIGGGCGAEALRVVKGMPTWIPGRQQSNPVRVRFTLPVKFGLQ